MMFLYSLNFPNGKKYIGIAANPKRRYNNHCARSGKGKNTSPVYDAIRKHGFPTLQILCVGNTEYIQNLETKAILHFKTRNRKLGYNVALGGTTGNKGNKASPETRAKLSAIHKGKPKSAEHNAKNRAAQKGRIISDDHRSKLSAALIGHPSYIRTPEMRASLREVLLKRPIPPPSPEARARHAAALRGRPKSPEHRAALVAAWKKRKAMPRASTRGRSASPPNNQHNPKEHPT